MNWKKIRLGDLFEQYRIEHIVQDNIDYGQITISKNGYIKFRTTKNGKSIGRKRQFIIDLKKYPNTLLFTRQGVADGAIAFAPKEVNNCIVTENMPMFSLKKGISVNFVKLLLKSEQYKNQVKKLIPTGSAQKSIHERDLMKISLYIPHEDEQKKLSDIIDKNLNNIKILNTEIQTQQTLLKKLRQSILQETIEGKLTAFWREKNPNIESASMLLEKIKAEKEELIKTKKIKKQKPLLPIQDSEVPFNIPKNWVWCRLGEVCSKIGAGSTPKGSNYSDNGILFFRSQNIYNDRLVYKDIKYISKETHEKMSGTKIYPEDILLNITGGSLGRCSYVPKEFKNGNLNQHVCIIRLILINSLFIHKLILSPNFQKMIFSSTTGAGREGLPKVNLERFIIPLPPLQEQKEIVKKIESLFKLCYRLEEQIKNSKESSQKLMQSVLREAFEVEEK